MTLQNFFKLFQVGATVFKVLSGIAIVFGIFRLIKKKSGKSSSSSNPIVQGVTGGLLSIFKFLGYLWLAGYATMFGLWLAQIEGFDSKELPIAFVFVSAVTFIVFLYLSAKRKKFDLIAFLILMSPGVFVISKPFLQ